MKKLFLIFIALFSFSIIANAQIQKFQAAYTHNICKHLEWPVEYKKGNFIIGVLGNDPIIKEFKKIAATKKYINQKIEVKLFKNTSAITKCHVLFISARQTSKTKAVLAKVGKNKTLVITSKKGAINLGSGINFVLIKSKLKFEIKKANITKRGIKVSSTIEKLAVKVY